MNFSSYSKQWSDLTFPLFKPATVATFRSHLVRLNAAFGDQAIDIGYLPAQTYFTGVSKELSPKSVKNLAATFHMILDAARREGLIEKVPEVKLPKAERTGQDWLTVQALRSIISDSSARYRPLYATLSETGLRIGEALGLRKGDLDEINGTIKVQRSVYGGRVQAPKTSASYRTLTLSPHLLEILKPLAQGEPEELVFKSSRGTPLWPDKVLAKNLYPLLGDLKLKSTGFHAFRRGNATLMCSILGIPTKVAAYRLGHQAEGLTLGVYAQSFSGIDKEWAPKIGEALFK